MKHNQPRVFLIVFMLLLGFCLPAYLFVTRSSDIADSSEAKKHVDEESQIPGQTKGSVCTSAGEAHDHGTASLRSFSAPHPTSFDSLADIPEGAFRDGLEKLPHSIQKEVLKTLSEDPSLRTDLESLRVDSGGALYFVCSFTPRAHVKMQEASALVESGGLELSEITGDSISISTPISLHSRPGSSKVLFLDFDGHVVENTRWNDTRGISRWDCLPYDKDGNTSTFSTTELSYITQIWERVSEDFAPFDVDVTTEQPAQWTMTTGHALITPGVDANGTNCPHAMGGGVAYLNVFGTIGYNYYSPAWCKDFNEASAAEVISHELGHNLSLAHDGSNNGITNIVYYEGHEVGSVDWAPIMGVSYGDDVSQWCKGEYLYANNTSEDDLADIAGLLSYRPDDAGSNNVTATPLTNIGDVITHSGVIGKTDETDVFSFYTGVGYITMSANTYRAATRTWGCNLDILLELYDSSGILIASNNVASDVNASITMAVPAGTYYLHVKPVGVGDPLNGLPTGYTSYGSLGQYSLSGIIVRDLDNDVLPDQWEDDYFGSITGAVASADSDGDGSDNLEEYVAGTNPTNSASVFKVTSFSAPASGNAPFIITWDSVEGRVYNVEWTDDLVAFPFSDISGDLPFPANSYTDTVERINPDNMYQIRVYR